VYLTEKTHFPLQNNGETRIFNNGETRVQDTFVGDLGLSNLRFLRNFVKAYDSNLLDALAFLTERRVRTFSAPDCRKCNGGRDVSLIAIRSEVHSGSVMGPVIFLIFVNEISDNISRTPRQYADKTKLLENTERHSKKASLKSDIDIV
jgi:hypothetical protein